MVPSVIVSRITKPSLKSLYIVATESYKFLKMKAKNYNFCTLCYLHFQVPSYSRHYLIAEIFSFDLVCIMSKLSHKQPRYQRKGTTGTTWRPDHRCLSLRHLLWSLLHIPLEILIENVAVIISFEIHYQNELGR